MSSETRAVTIVTPADGPSFGTAPAGKCTWIDRSNADGSMPSSPACARTQDSAMEADSFITSPSWPVTVSPAVPSATDVST